MSMAGPVWASLVLLVSLLPDRGEGGGWYQDRPRVSLDYLHGPLADTLIRFRGNSSSADSFKIVVEDGTALYVGGMNTIYILNAKNLKEHTKLRIDWPPEAKDYELCLIKGNSKVQCQNFIRVIAKTDKNRILICGTHAFRPRCRYYKYKEAAYTMDQEFDGKGLTPYDPAHNSSYLLADGELYTATVSDFSGADPLIYKDPLRTEQYDSKVLNGPDFVKTLQDEDYVYFFFREQAVEYINCGKSVYSRVARVCKNDRGGPNKFKNRWTTYLKSRLNCSLPGDYPFYFNHLQSVSSILEGEYLGVAGTRLVYALFTTPENAIGGNAICAFQIKDILTAFQGAFKEQETSNSNWLPVRENKLPDPRPATCSQDSQSLSESSLRFVQDHSIMDESVPAYFGARPLFIQTNIQHPSQYREIAVDSQVKTADGLLFDVLFVGTDNGRVLKIVHPTQALGEQPHLVEEIQVASTAEPVLGLQLIGGDLLVVVRKEVLLLPLQRCSVAVSCSTCVGLQDPYCGWNVIASKCIAVSFEKNKAKSSVLASEILQNVTTGLHRQCGDSDSPTILIEQFTDVHSHGDNSHDVDLRIELQEGRYSTEELSTAVITSCACALLLGFIAGFLVARKCRCEPDNPYHVPYLNRTSYEEENIYAKVDDMTYYPVVSPQYQTEPGAVDTTATTTLPTKHHSIINNFLTTDQLETKTLNLHQVNQHKKDFNTFNAFGTVHRAQKIYL